jgi:uncharacterized tellurite resistance protein B-like protein
MEINSLSREELIVFVTLVEKIVMADRKASNEEIVHLDKIVSEIGEELYKEMIKEAEGKWASGEETKKFLKTVTNQESRDLIYGTILEIAIEDGLNTSEIELLTWLEENWEIKVEIIKE